MANPSLGAALRHIRTLTDGPSLADVPDGQLLERFVSRRDEAAFAALVRRHGPMVLGVCRRILGRLQDAEDAFQATFLLLARKARSIRKQGSVGSWLHGVAHRLAVKAKGRDSRRQAHERRAGSMRKIEAGVQAAWKDLQEALDAALQRLPEHYRTALVLCHLEGRTHEEAAYQLSCPTATLRSRLTRGRKLLRKELTRRGVVLSAGAVGVALLANTAEAAMPALLINATAKSALLFAAGDVAAASVRGSVAALAEEGAKAMGMTKVKLLAMLLAALSVVGVGVGAIARQAAVAGPPQDKSADAKPAAAAPPRPEDEKQARLDDYGDPLPPGAVRRVGTLRFRQGGGTVNSLLAHPDGKRLVTGAYYGNRTICVWDLATGKLQQSFPGSWYDKRIALSPDGTTLAAALGEDKIALWNLATGKESSRLEWKGCVPCGFAFSPDGKILAVGGEIGSIDFWDLTTGKHIERRKTPNRVTLLAFAPDGKTLASGDWAEATVSLWDAASGEELHRLTGPKSVEAFAFSPDGALLASGGVDLDKPHGAVSIWDVNTGKLVHEWPGGRAITSVAFSPQGKALASVEDGEDDHQVLVLRDASSGTVVRSFKKRQAIVSVAFSTDGKTLITGDTCGTIHLWDADTGNERTPTGGNLFVWNAALSPDGRTLAYDSNNIRFWDMAEGREIGELPSEPYNSESVAFAPDGKSLASVDPRAIFLWDVSAHKLFRRIEKDKKEKHDWFCTAAFAPDGKTLVSGAYDGAVRFWDPASGKELRRVSFRKDGERKEQSVSPNALAFSPDGRTLAASGRTPGTAASRVRLWDVAAEDQVPPLLWEIEMPMEENRSPSGSPWLISVDSKVVFSPDGHMLAMNRYQKSIPVWEAATGKERLLLMGHQESTCCVAFAPDGRTLASSGFDDTIRLWDLETGDELRTLTGHRGKANSLVFSADGKTLVSTGDDTTLMFWDVDAITHRPRPKAVRLSSEECESRWADLADADAAKAYRAVRAFATDPTAAAFLGERLRPARAARQGDVDRWIAALNSDDFDEREKATRELADVGEAAGPALRKAVNGQPSAEVRNRAGGLLERLATPAPELLRGLRAVEALETVGGPEARKVLETLAKGAAESRLTREANASLQRMGG